MIKTAFATDYLIKSIDLQENIKLQNYIVRRIEGVADIGRVVLKCQVLYLYRARSVIIGFI